MKNDINKFIIKSLEKKNISNIMNFIDSSSKEYDSNTLNLLGVLKYKYCLFNEAKDLWIRSYNIDKNIDSQIYLKSLESEECTNIKVQFEESLQLISKKQYNLASKQLVNILEYDCELIEIYILISMCQLKLLRSINALYYISKAYKIDKSSYKIKYIILISIVGCVLWILVISIIFYSLMRIFI